MVRRLVLLLCCLSCPALAQSSDAGPLELDGGLSLSARGMLAPLLYVPSTTSNGDGLALSVTGSEGFAIWSDHRNFYDGTLYGTRLGPSGAVLDPGGIRVGPRGKGWGVVPLAGQHLVFVQDEYSHLLLYRVSPQSGLLSATPVSLSNIPSLYRVSLACATAVCLVAWTASDGVYAVRFDSTLTALDSTPLKVGGGNNGFSTTTGVASNGTDFLIATRVSASLDGGPASSQLVTAKVTAQGATTPYQPLPLPAVYDVSLTGRGGRYLVAGSTSYQGPYVALRLDGDGSPVDAAPFSLAPQGTGIRYWPAVVSTGADFWVVWDERGVGAAAMSVLKGVRLPIQGSAGSPTAKVLSTSTTGRRLAGVAGAASGFWAGVSFAATSVTTENQPTLNRFDSAGSSLDGEGIPIRLVPDTQGSPAVAWGGGCYLAVWEGNRSTPYLSQIHARRFDAAGQPLGAPFRVSASSMPQKGASVAFDGTNFLVTWNEQLGTTSRVRGARVSGPGAVLDPSGIDLSPTGLLASEARVAFAGGVFGVIWTELEQVTLQSRDIRLQRVSPQGVVLDPTPISVVVDYGYSQQQPAIFSSGTQFLALWRDSKASSLSPQLYGTRVSPQGALLDSPTLNVSGRTSVGSTGMSDYAPSAAYANGEWLVVYNTETSTEAASRISSGGVVLEARRKLVFNGGADLASPSATGFDGQRFRYLWDGRNTYNRQARYGAWDTSSDAGPAAAGAWSEVMDSVAMAQSAPSSALLVSSAPLLAGFPLLERGWRRAVRFCPPGGPCAAPALFDDAGTPPWVDAGTPDAGAFDGGLLDGGTLDAGAADAGGADAGGSPDSGPAPGPTDGGPDLDSGEEPDPAASGCGCQSAAGPLAIWALLLLAARRRSRVSASR